MHLRVSTTSPRPMMSARSERRLLGYCRAVGITIFEILIVMAVIGVLLALALPAYQNYSMRAKVSPGDFAVLRDGAKRTNLSALVDPPASVDVPNELRSGYERSLRQTLVGAIARFNNPAEIERERTKTVKLVISRRKSGNELKPEVDAYGPSKAVPISVGSVMQALLVSDDETGLTVVETTPQFQDITADSETYWQWNVRAKRVGTYKLTLTIAVDSDIDGNKKPRAVKSHEESIVVSVGAKNAVLQFIYDNWQWLWTAIVVPIGVWIWRRKSKKKTGVENSWKPGRGADRED